MMTVTTCTIHKVYYETPYAENYRRIGKHIRRQPQEDRSTTCGCMRWGGGAGMLGYEAVEAKGRMAEMPCSWAKCVSYW